MKAKTGNPNEPWFPVCEDHTEYHLKEIRPGKTRAMYTCNECGSNTWNPTKPFLFGVVVIVLILGLNFLMFAADKNNTAQLQPGEILLGKIATLGMSIFMVAVVWGNSKHWRKFQKWRKKLYQEKIDAVLEQK